MTETTRVSELHPGRPRCHFGPSASHGPPLVAAVAADRRQALASPYFAAARQSGLGSPLEPAAILCISACQSGAHL